MQPTVKKEDGRHPISFEQNAQACDKVRKNQGAAGIDGMTWEDFDKNRAPLLYKLWNRMTSGSYFPVATLEIEIPKAGGGKRKLGVPTLLDRIAQQVVVEVIEEETEKQFHPDSYGYRPNRSAHDAIAKCRQRCGRYEWVIDLDIKGFFDSINHELLMKAVERFISGKWILMYVRRWLKAPIQKAEGNTEQRTKGTPQGGVISPVLANIFLHFAIDKWMEKNYSFIPLERYADDVIVHCASLVQAQWILKQITERLNECGLELNSEKTRIVKCQKWGSNEKYPNKSFDFLGYRFKPRKARNKEGKMIGVFSPAISPKAVVRIRGWIRESKVFKQTNQTLMEMGKKIEKQTRGWINYYGKFRSSELSKLFDPMNKQIEKWYAKKHKQNAIESKKRIKQIATTHSYLFVHWYRGFTFFQN